jgi:hypothetical protein
MRHFFAANDPDSIRESSFCDNSAVFNCGSSAYSSISPYEQLEAIFQALVDEAVGDTRFMENWVE